MEAKGKGSKKIVFWVALIGFLGLVVGVVIGNYYSHRGSNLIEVTRIVEVTREIERPIEVTRSVTETKVIEVTRIVEIVQNSPTQESFSNQGSDDEPPESTGSAIIGVLADDGRVSLGTHTVALFPKTLIDDKGEAQPNRDQEVRVPVNELTGFAEVYGLPVGTYAVCLESLLHTATIGELEIFAGEITRADFRWPAEIEIIRVECVL